MVLLGLKLLQVAYAPISHKPFYSRKKMFLDESGWAWFIPLHNGTTSVGVVMNEKMYKASLQRPASPWPFKSEATACANQSSAAARYISNLSFAPGVIKLITSSGSLEQGSVKSASDFSYSAPSYGGPGYRIIGDAGGTLLLLHRLHE